MRRLALLVGLTLVLGSFPVATANHFGVGFRDAYGTGPSEAPNDDDRSVPGTTLNESDGQEYGIGTSTECREEAGAVNPEDPDQNVQEAQAAASAHAFCGMLIYYQGDDDLQQVSTPDQDLRGPVETFDVVRANTVGTGTGTCLPFCEQVAGEDNPGESNPFGVSLFNETHDAGSEAGFTNSSEEAYDREKDRSSPITFAPHVRGPGQTIQETTGFWEMNGWWWPTLHTTFVAYLEEEGGDPITDEDLEEIVSDMKEEGDQTPGLHASTEPAVCGYTPDFVFTTVGPGAAGLNCEFSFTYFGTGDGDTRFDGYEDECASPTYVCSANNGPAWYYELCYCLGLIDPEVPGSGPLPGGPYSTLGGPEGQTDHIRWHFVVAPHNSECGGAQEPGFSFDGDGAANPYLAHDLDVYTTAASTSAHDAGSAVPEVIDYSDEVASEYTSDVAEALGDPTEALPSELPVPADTSQVVRSPTLEPNLASDTPVGELDDSSRTYENGDLTIGDLDRSLEDVCERLFAQEEPETVDKWVDYLDSRAIGIQDVDVTGTYATDERVQRQIGPYASSSDSQDGTNRPGPSLYGTSGQVGFFTDKDDDGEYDQLEAGVKYNADTVLAGGAYPMIWDMAVGDNGEPHESQGCEFANDNTISQEAAALGYGVDTGLAQAIYLNEPTAFLEPDSRTVLPFANGNNIYLLLSQSANEHWTSTLGDEDNDLDEDIDHLVEQLQDYVTANFDRDAPDVVLVNDAFDLDTAFQNQCSGLTGNFDSEVQFAHDCSAFDCEGDTIATLYSFDIAEGTLEGSEILPTFSPGETPYEFDVGQHAWYDVDPFDNDPDRNEQRQEAPPHPDAGLAGEGVTPS